MKSRFTVFTSELLWKLADIGKHLRDCTEDIVTFSKFFADQLVASGKDQLRPWDFVREWKKLIDSIHFEISNPLSPHEILEPIKLARWKPEQLHNFDQKMMPIFAEDLCGKEFAEVAVLYCGDLHRTREQQAKARSTKFGVIRGAPVPHEMNLALPPGKETKATWEAFDRCHPFPPGDPVMVDEAKKCKENYFRGPNFAEHFTAPPGYEYGPHGEV